jgi:hypothetical protein
MSNRKLAKLALGGLSAALVALAGTASPLPGTHHGAMAPTNAPSGERAAAAPFLVQGKTMNLQSFKGQPVMLWQVATWCPSCAIGLQTLAQHQALIDASKLKVIILRDYQNGGYPGMDMEKFVAANAPALLHDSHFLIGEDTQALYKLYNPRHFIDVYYLIEPNGQVALTASAPSMSFDKIEQFIRKGGKS